MRCKTSPTCPQPTKIAPIIADNRALVGGKSGINATKTDTAKTIKPITKKNNELDLITLLLNWLYILYHVKLQ